MNVIPTGPTFVASLTTGNPLPQTIVVNNTSSARWQVQNVFNTTWIRMNPNAGAGDGFFSLSVNIYDSSVVQGIQTAVLFVDSINPAITMVVTLVVSP